MYLELLKESISNLSLDEINKASELIASLKNPNKVWICGNGGDASLANHFETDLMKFAQVPAISLCSNQSMISMIGNDYGYKEIFSWQIDKLSIPGDIVICLSTSGKSKNILRGAWTTSLRSDKINLISIIGEGGLRGKHGPTDLSKISDILIVIPNLSHPMPLEDVQSAVCHMITIEVAKIKGIFDC